MRTASTTWAAADDRKHHARVVTVRRLGRERTRSVGEYRVDGVDDGSSPNAWETLEHAHELRLTHPPVAPDRERHEDRDDS
jgi:hypothetical protein